MKIRFLFFIILFVAQLYSSNNTKVFPTVNIYLEKPSICSNNLQVWQTIESKLIFEIKGVKHFKLFHYKIDSIQVEDFVRLKFELTDCKSKENFKIRLKIYYDKFEISRDFEISSNYELSNFPENLIEYLKSLFPLTGVVIDVKQNMITISIGKNYDIENGDKFLIISDDNKVIGAGIVINSFENYSILKITKQIEEIKNFYRVRKYNHNLANKLNSFKFKFKKNGLTSPYTIENIKSKRFKVFSSEYTNYILIAGEKESLFMNIDNFYIEKFEQLSFNEILNCKFSYDNKYCGYLYKDGLNYGLRIWDLVNFKKYDILKDSENNIFLYDIHNATKFPPASIEAFAFSKSNSDLYFFSEGKLIKFSMSNKKFEEIELENKIQSPKDIFILPNDEKILIECKSKKILIKDLLDNTEDILDNIKWHTLDRSGFEILFSDNDSNLNLFNFYNKNFRYFFIPDLKKIKKVIYSPSEEFIGILRDNLIDVYIPSSNLYIKDIFRSGEIKEIKDFNWISGYNFLVIFGKLYDSDNNKKIDYKDKNYVVLFDPKERETYNLLDNIDDFYSISSDGNYIIYSKDNKIQIYQIPYEKILLE